MTERPDDARYWVGFSQAKFIGPTRIARLRERFGDLGDGERLDALASSVAAGDSDPYAAADSLLADLA